MNFIAGKFRRFLHKQERESHRENSNFVAQRKGQNQRKQTQNTNETEFPAYQKFVIGLELYIQLKVRPGAPTPSLFTLKKL